MRTAFLILGYGVPDNIFTDTNYGTYLRTAFNEIWSDRALEKHVLLAGGRTDVRPPYRRTEAGQMTKFLARLMRRPFLRPTTSAWRIYSNHRPLGVAESLVWFHAFIERRRCKRAVVFCEETRYWRIDSLVSELFPGEDVYVEVHGLDFDMSANRYRPREEIEEREQAELDLDTWALESEQNLVRYRRLRGERLKFLRAAGPKRHAQSIQAWEKREPEMRKRLGIPV